MNIEEYQKQQVEYKNTTFYIDKLPAIKAFKVLEKIRLSVSTQTLNDSSSLMSAIGALPIEIVEDIQSNLFESVKFTKKGTYNNKTELKASMQGSAFEELDPMDIYELTLRCLVINFFYSFQKLKNLINTINPQQDLIK